METAIQQRGHAHQWQLENKVQCMNQLAVVRSIQGDMRTMLLKHRVHASRAIVNAMSAFGVEKMCIERVPSMGTIV